MPAPKAGGAAGISKHWKFLLHFFQGLEKAVVFISNLWKTESLNV
jgi:hypothetical protein